VRDALQHLRLSELRLLHLASILPMANVMPCLPKLLYQYMSAPPRGMDVRRRARPPAGNGRMDESNQPCGLRRRLIH